MKLPSLSQVAVVLAGASAVAVVALGCGTSGDGLFGKGAGRGAGAGAGDASTGAGASSTSATTASGNAETSSSSSAQGGGGAGPSSSNATSTSASVSASSSSSGGGGKLDCNGQTCPQGGPNACCWDRFGLNGDPQGECVQSAMDCETQLQNGPNGPSGAETLIQCETPGQCSGAQVCCGKKVYSDVGQYYSEVTCKPSCDWPDVTLCDIGDPTFICPMVDDGSGFLQQTVCKPSSLLPAGYYVCGLP